MPGVISPGMRDVDSAVGWMGGFGSMRPSVPVPCGEGALIAAWAATPAVENLRRAQGRVRQRASRRIDRIAASSRPGLSTSTVPKPDTRRRLAALERVEISTSPDRVGYAVVAEDAGQGDDLDAGHVGPDARRGPDAVHAGHEDVCQDDLGTELRNRAYRLLAVAGPDDHGQPGLAPQEQFQTLPDDPVVVGDQDPDRAGFGRFPHSHSAARRR
jgi:hypothetical protein